MIDVLPMDRYEELELGADGVHSSGGHQGAAVSGDMSSRCRAASLRIESDKNESCLEREEGMLSRRPIFILCSLWALVSQTFLD